MPPSALYIDLAAIPAGRWREILERHERELDPRNAVIVSTVADMRAREERAAAERASFWRRVEGRTVLRFNFDARVADPRIQEAIESVRRFGEALRGAK